MLNFVNNFYNIDIEVNPSVHFYIFIIIYALSLIFGTLTHKYRVLHDT